MSSPVSLDAPPREDGPVNVRNETSGLLKQLEEFPGLVLDLARPSANPRAQGLRPANTTVVILFFFSGMGCTIGYTSVLSNLVYYSKALGMNSYLFLNLAIYAPMFPVTLAQARWDSYFDRRFQSMRSFSFRGFVGFVVTIVSIALVPWASKDLVALSLLSTLMGTASSALQGTLMQMASFVYPNCGRLQAAVTSGMQASAILVLIVSLATAFGASGESEGIVEFYLAVTALVCLCCVCYGGLMSRSEDVLESMLRRDSSIGSQHREPLLADDDSASDMGSIEGPLDTEMAYAELWYITWPCCVSVMVTVAASMSVASWFNRVKSTDPSNQSLPQVLFYTRILADLLGRPTTLLLKTTAGHWMLLVSTLRLLFVPLFFLYASTELIPRNDILIVGGVAGFAFSSGYIVTACYQLAPTLLSIDQQASSTKQAGLMNVCFSGSLLCGLLVSFGLLGGGL